MPHIISQLHSSVSKLRLRHAVFFVLLCGVSLPAHAADDSPAPLTPAPHTSWASAVRAALARKAHKVATWTQSGVASWYGRHFHGRKTSDGSTFNSNDLTAAHPSLPLGTKLLVTSEDTGRSVVVTVNDRGPFNHRIIDLSHAAAEKIGMVNSGTAHVKIAPLAPKNASQNEVAEAPSSAKTVQEPQQP
ncbi:septal ring lytic transglycosylase RlpA family protein [Swingsia samuiensis]|uniref:Endolytic peptidoglycan transglycosylase RlpA n=1 Tax=Swingsia samuiensis TaxID=1293412 RepID=A0A4Y6UJV9_9PROT|nr:septal ring lytic transglycosylase RlpA family protein [Swingsia samuiensis]QDH17344.1 septal ring lytic transglycosylase RlpA family protein [Swingsia samuiensis]